MKTCSSKICREVNPQSLDNFHKNKNRYTGFNDFCKRCRKSYKEANSDKVFAGQLRYRLKNKEKLKTNVSLYRQNNLEKERLRGRINGQRFRKLNPEKTKMVVKGASLKKYWPGLSNKECLASYQELLLEQNSVCRICKEPEKVYKKKGVQSLSVDHNHITGKVRGLLCFRCNRGIGLFKENRETFKSAMEYLEMYEPTKEII